MHNHLLQWTGPGVEVAPAVRPVASSGRPRLLNGFALYPARFHGPMSYDIRLSIFSDEPLSDANLAAADDVFRRYNAKPMARSEGFSVRWDDGSGFTLYSRSVNDRSAGFSGLLSPLGDLSHRFCDFTFDFAIAIGCLIRPDIIPPLVLVVHPLMLADLPSTIATKAKVIHVSSGFAVRNALSESYYGWRGLRAGLAREINDLDRGTPEGGV